METIHLSVDGNNSKNQKVAMKKTSLAMLIMLALSAGFAVQSSWAKSTVNSVVLTEFSLPDIDGKLQTVSQWSGKVLVINFWATWCSPCLKEIPAFIKLQESYQQRGVQFIGIAIDESDAVKAYLKTIPNNYPHLIAGDSGINLSRDLGNTANAVPFTLVVDQSGKIIFQQAGELSSAKLSSILNSLVAGR